DDILINLVRAPVLHMNVYGGEAFQELLQVRRKVMQPDTVDRRQPDRARNNIFDFLQLAVQSVVGLNNLLAVIVKNLTLPGEPEFLFTSLDQQRFENPLQGTNLLADRRLGHTVDLGG